MIHWTKAELVGEFRISVTVELPADFIVTRGIAGNKVYPDNQLVNPAHDFGPKVTLFMKYCYLVSDSTDAIVLIL